MHKHECRVFVSLPRQRGTLEPGIEPDTSYPAARSSRVLALHLLHLHFQFSIPGEFDASNCKPYFTCNQLQITMSRVE